MRQVAREMPSRWSTSWDSASLRWPRGELRAAIDEPTLPRMIAAACESDLGARVASAIMDSSHIRGMVRATRCLPAHEKSRDLAWALAHLYSPRRQIRMPTADDRAEDARSRYPYIAYPPEDFFDRLALLELLDHEGRFLDVGSGVGEKLFLAYALGRFARCDGIEVNQQLLAIADYLMANLRGDEAYPFDCFADDALSFAGYGDYDVIYMYRPISDDELYKAMMRQIVSRLRPGGIVFDVYFHGMNLRREHDGLYQATPNPRGTVDWTGPVDLEVVLEEGLRSVFMPV